MGRSLLLYVPAMPLTLESLFPQRALATVASALLERGYGTHILDYGTLQSIDRFAFPAFREAAGALGEQWEGSAHSAPFGRFSGFRKYRHLEGLFEQHRQRWRREIVQDIRASLPVDVVFFLVNTRLELFETRAVSAVLRKACPEIKQFFFGPYAEECGAMLAATAPTVDGVCLAEPEQVLPQVAMSCSCEETLRQVPNMAFYDRDSVYCTPVELSNDLDAMSLPQYDTQLYPALRGDEKALLFSLEQTRGGGEEVFGRVCQQGKKVRTRSPGMLCEEVAEIGRTCGGRVFHIEGMASSALQMDAVASLIMARGWDVAYSRSAQARHVESVHLQTLAQSGCQAMGLQADTGSQRLLEDFYGRKFGVTQLEKGLHALRDADIYTVANFCYPCPMDDYHTRAETLRVLKRATPNAAPVRAPWLSPLSAWFQYSNHYGYRVHHGRYTRWIAAMDEAPSWFERLTPDIPYRMTGWSRGRVAAELQTLSEEIRALHIATQVTERRALMARVTGHEGDVEHYTHALERMLFTFDAEGLAKCLSAFNCKAARTKNQVVFRPFSSFLAAVGN